MAHRLWPVWGGHLPDLPVPGLYARFLGKELTNLATLRTGPLQAYHIMAYGLYGSSIIYETEIIKMFVRALGLVFGLASSGFAFR